MDQRFGTTVSEQVQFCNVSEFKKEQRKMNHVRIVDVDQVGVAARALAIAPEAPSAVSISADVRDKHYRAMELAQKHDLSLSYVGHSLAFTGIHIHRGDHSDWAVMPIGIDPLYNSWGEYLYVPEAVREDVGAILEAGINFDAVYIAHEIPAGSVQPGKPVPLELLLPPPPRTARSVKALENPYKTYWQGTLSLLGTLSKVVPIVVGGMAVGAAALVVGGAFVLAAGATAVLSFDPMLFGLYVDRSQRVNGQHPALFYYLTSWYWPADE